MILLATHIPTGQSSRFELKGKSFRLGRAGAEDPEDKLSVPFDPKLSRRLALLELHAGVLSVQRDQSRYPLFHEGQEKERFQLLAGQRFSSGETVFELQEEAAQTLTVHVMERVNRGNAEKILQVLLSFQSLLNRWQEPGDLALESVELLKELIPDAQVAFFELDLSGETRALTPTALRPSRSLTAECLKEKLPAYHVWTSSGGLVQPTQFGDESWALAAPVLSTVDTLVLYAVGGRSRDIPGELERSALALVAQILAQHLEGRRSVVLQARVDAEARANRNLRLLLETIERSLSLHQEDGIEKAFLEGARRLSGAETAQFKRDLGAYLPQGGRSRLGSDSQGCFLAVAFEHFQAQGILCHNPLQRPFTSEHEAWLLALSGFAETVLENRRLHRQVRSSLDQLKESQAQLVRSSQWAAAGRLAANAAHELNTPLGAIKLSAETALSFLGEEAKAARGSLDLIQRSVDRCRKVTERLLVYSRPKEESEPEPFALWPVLDDSLSSLAPSLESRSVELTCSVEPHWQVLGNFQDCYWALTNVLKNAVEALAECDQPRKIRLSSRREDDLLLLSLEDSGPGIPEELGEQIFEPFFSTKKIGEGNGLGLAISRRNMRAWGGDLRLGHSGLGGAAFTMSLPLANL